jgi:hypothetical protein
MSHAMPYFIVFSSGDAHHCKVCASPPGVEVAAAAGDEAKRPWVTLGSRQIVHQVVGVEGRPVLVPAPFMSPQLTGGGGELGGGSNSPARPATTILGLRRAEPLRR